MPEHKKDEKWHKHQIREILKQHCEQYGVDAFGENIDQYQEYLDHYRFYFGKQQNVDYAFMEQIVPGVNKPANWLPGQKIASLVDFMKGTALKNITGFNVTARAITKETIKKREEAYQKAMLQLELKPMFKQMEQMVGVPFQPVQGFEPNAKEDVDRLMSEMDEKEFAAKVAKAFATEAMYANHYQEILPRVFFDTCVAGIGCIKVYPYHQKVKWRTVLPINAICDRSAESDLNRNARFGGEQRFLPLMQVFQEYELSDEDKKKLVDFANNEDRQRECNTEGGRTWWRKEGNTLYVNVVDIEWLDWKIQKYEESEDKYGNPNLVKTKRNKVTAKEKEVKKKSIVNKEWYTIRQGTLIGDCILINWGERTNQVRSMDGLGETQLSYLFFTPGMLLGQNVSIVKRLKEHQNRIDMYRYKIQEAVRNDKGVAFTFDYSQLPAGMQMSNILIEIQTNNVIGYDSTASEDTTGRPPSGKYFEKIDLSLADKTITAYLILIEKEKLEMEEIVNIPRIMQGMQTEIIGKAVQSQTIAQAAVGTLHIYNSFFNYVDNLLQYSANLFKIITTIDADHEGQYRVSENQYAWLKFSEDLLFEDIKVYISARDIIDEQSKNRMLDQAFAMAQNGAIDMLDMVKMQQLNSYSEVANYLEASLKAKKAEQQQQQMAQAQQAQALQAQQLQAQQQQTVLSEAAKNEREQFKGVKDVAVEGMRQHGAHALQQQPQ